MFGRACCDEQVTLSVTKLNSHNFVFDTVPKCRSEGDSGAGHAVWSTRLGDLGRSTVTAISPTLLALVVSVPVSVV